MGNQKLYRLYVHMWIHVYSITCTTPQQTVYREGSNKQLLTYALNKHIFIKLWKYPTESATCRWVTAFIICYLRLIPKPLGTVCEWERWIIAHSELAGKLKNFASHYSNQQCRSWYAYNFYGCQPTTLTCKVGWPVAQTYLSECCLMCCSHLVDTPMDLDWAHQLVLSC